MAHVTSGLVVEGRFAWDDVGSWDRRVRVSRTLRPTLTLGGRNVWTVSGDSHVVVTVGMEDVIVVHTPEATLVCHAGATQGVRDVVSRLSRRARLSR